MNLTTDCNNFLINVLLKPVSPFMLNSTTQTYQTILVAPLGGWRDYTRDDGSTFGPVQGPLLTFSSTGSNVRGSASFPQDPLPTNVDFTKKNSPPNVTTARRRSHDSVGEVLGSRTEVVVPPNSPAQYVVGLPVANEVLTRESRFVNKNHQGVGGYLDEYFPYVYGKEIQVDFPALIQQLMPEKVKKLVTKITDKTGLTKYLGTPSQLVKIELGMVVSTVTFSPADNQDLVPPGHVFQLLPVIEAGVTFVLGIHMPNVCEGTKPEKMVCTFIHKYFGDPALVFLVALTLEPSLVVSVMLENIFLKFDKFGRPLVGFTQIGLEFRQIIPNPLKGEIEIETSITALVVMTFEIGKDPNQVVVYEPGVAYPWINPLVFTGAIVFENVIPGPGPTLSFTLALVGDMVHAFGIEWLAFTGFGVTFGVLLEVPFPPSIVEIAAGVFLGRNCFAQDPATLQYSLSGSGPCLGAKIAGGVDFGDPSSSLYFVLEVYGLNVRSLLGIFCPCDISKVPKFLLDTGFPTLYNEGGEMIPNPHISINLGGERQTVIGDIVPAGIILSGTLNIFGFVAKLNLEVNPIKFYFKFLLLLSAVQLKVGSTVVLTMARSRFDLAAPAGMEGDGPIVYINLELLHPENCIVYINCKLGLLGAVVEAAVQITPTTFQAYCILQLFGLVEVDVSLTASVNLDHFDFKKFSAPVHALIVVRPTFIATIVKGVVDAIAKIAKLVLDIIEAFKKDLEKAQAALNKVLNDLTKAKADCNKKLEPATNKLNKAIAKLNDFVVKQQTAKDKMVAATNDLASKRNELDTAQAKVDALTAPCTKEICACVNLLVKCCINKCKKKTGQCGGNDCWYRGSEVGCVLRNSGCDIQRAAYDVARNVATFGLTVAQGGLQVAVAASNTATNAFQKIIDVEKPLVASLVNVAQKVVTDIMEGICSIVDLAKLPVQLAQVVVDGALKVLQEITNKLAFASDLSGVKAEAAVSKFIQIHSISIELNLDFAELLNTELELSIDITFRDTRKFSKLTLNLKKMFQTVWRLMKEYLPGFREFTVKISSIVDKVAKIIPSLASQISALDPG